jgi:hypothetical protein
MSENWLRLIPADPRYIPSPEAQEQARRALAWLAPRAAEVRATATPHVRFIDPGANLAQVRCPACGVDVTGWRRLAMDRAWRAPASARGVRIWLPRHDHAMLWGRHVAARFGV